MSSEDGERTVLVRSVTEARSQLSDLVTQVRHTDERVTVTVRGEEAAVLVGAEQFAAMEQTITALALPECEPDPVGGASLAVVIPMRWRRR